MKKKKWDISEIPCFKCKENDLNKYCKHCGGGGFLYITKDLKILNYLIDEKLKEILVQSKKFDLIKGYFKI